MNKWFNVGSCHTWCTRAISVNQQGAGAWMFDKLDDGRCKMYEQTLGLIRHTWWQHRPQRIICLHLGPVLCSTAVTHIDSLSSFTTSMNLLRHLSFLLLFGSSFSCFVFMTNTTQKTKLQPPSMSYGMIWHHQKPVHNW